MMIRILRQWLAKIKQEKRVELLKRRTTRPNNRFMIDFKIITTSKGENIIKVQTKEPKEPIKWPKSKIPQMSLQPKMKLKPFLE